MRHQQLVDSRRLLLISDVSLVGSCLETLCADHPDMLDALGLQEPQTDEAQHATSERSPKASPSRRPTSHRDCRTGLAILVLAVSVAERVAAVGTTRQVNRGSVIEFRNPTDVDQAFDSAREMIRSDDATPPRERFAPTSGDGDYLLARFERSMGFISIPSIAYVVADSSCTRVHTSDGRRARSTRSLAAWERLLSESKFVRVHRSTILNLECVERVEGLPSCSRRVYLRGATEPIVMSRRYAARLNKRRV